jgi:hypothetical protein
MSRLFVAVILICFAASACDVEDQPQRRIRRERELLNLVPIP